MPAKKSELSFVTLVKHAGLLRKLEAAGATGKILEWFKNYLPDRRQRVIHPDVNFDWSKPFSCVGTIAFSNFHKRNRFLNTFISC